LKVPDSEIGGDGPFNGIGEWNRLRVSIKEGAATFTLNGKVQAEWKSDAMPKKGAFILRPEGEIEFANLFVRKLK
jgi:hypothetical protein